MELEAIKYFARTVLENDTTGHDWKHALRVESNVRLLSDADFSEAEIEVLFASAWLHDTIDEKLDEDKRQSIGTIRTLLEENGATTNQLEEILDIIQNLSYSKNIEKKRTLSKLGQIVQDADRLDAIGAIGIARTFYYGGYRGNALYDDTMPRTLEQLTEENYRTESSVLNHFYEKLLLLEETMNTEAGKEEARVRTQFMQTFLDRFYEEISDS